MQTRYTTVTDLAEQAGLNKRTVLRHIQEGRLPAERIGGSTTPWIIPADAAEAYLAARRQDAGDVQ